MPADRIPSTDNENDITSELMYLEQVIKDPKDFPEVQQIRKAEIKNGSDERKVGKFKSSNDRRSVTKGFELLQRWFSEYQQIPTFLVAGPRDYLGFKQRKVHAAIVTSGGTAPGLNMVSHSIVQRHHKTYEDRLGDIYGVQDSFLGMCNFAHHRISLKPRETEKWIDRGGSMLGMRRERGPQSGT
jgi:6-phosphofructokinase 1